MKDLSDGQGGNTWATLLKLPARVLLDGPSHRQDPPTTTFVNTSHVALATRNS